MKTLNLWPTNVYVFEDFLPEDKFNEILNLDLSGQQHIKIETLESKIVKSFTEIFQKEITEKNLHNDYTTEKLQAVLK